MIIISVIDEKIYMAAFLKNKTLSGPQASIAAGSPNAAEEISASFENLLKSNKGMLFDSCGAALFMDGKKSRFAAVKHPGISDQAKFDEFVRWTVKENFNIDKFEYSYADAGRGYIYLQAVEEGAAAGIKKVVSRLSEKIKCFDTHLFNEINYLRGSGVIDAEDFMLLKLSADHVNAVRVFKDGYFEHHAFDFMCAPLVYNCRDDQAGYGAQELTLMHELVKKVSRWQNDDKKRLVKPEKLFLLNAAGGDAPYYLRLRMTEELSDNLYYVNEKIPQASGGAFDYIGFNLNAMCDRWR